jgi:hypothetical protein
MSITGSLVDFFDRHGGSIAVLFFIASLFSADLRKMFFHIPLAKIQEARKRAAKRRVDLLRKLHANTYETMLHLAKVAAFHLQAAVAGSTVIASVMWFSYLHSRERDVPVILIHFIILAAVPSVFFIQALSFGTIEIRGLVNDLQDVPSALKRWSAITGNLDDAELVCPPDSLCVDEAQSAIYQ